MRANVKNIIKTAVFTALWFVFLCITVSMINRASSVFPDCIGYITNGYDRVSFSEISEAKNAESYPEIVINAQAISSGYVQSSEGAAASVEIIATDQSYVDFHIIDIVSGSFFSDSADSVGAVISESLANSLFGSTAVVGEKLYLLDSEITIVGVYKRDNSFLSEIASDGKEYIMISHSVSLTQDDEADYLYIKAKSSDGYFTALDEIKLNGLLDGKLDNYERLNLSENKRVIVQFKHMLIFSIGVIVFVALGRKLFKLIPLLRSDGSSKDIFFYVRLIGIILILVIIPFVVSFELYIPVGFFPVDRKILNVFHYINLFIDFVQSQNGGSYYFYDSLYFWSVITFIPLIVINVFYVIFLIKIYGVKHNRTAHCFDSDRRTQNRGYIA